MTKDEALDLALEALEMYLLETNSQFQRSAVTALREALAEQPAQQEPVSFEAFNAWMHHNLPVGTVIGHSGWWADKIYSRFIKHTSPPAQRTWVGLTKEEVFAVSNTMPYGDRFDFAEAIEAKLKEKNNG